MNLGASIRHNLTSLLRFSGRDPRWLFWPWVVVAVVAPLLVYYAATASILVEMMQRMFVFIADPQGAPPDPGKLMAGMEDRWRTAVWIGMGMQLVLALLIAASVARRLHDRGWAGWWGLAPLPFSLGNFALMPGYLASMADPVPDFGAIGPMMLNSLGFYVAFIGVVVLLAQPGTAGPNRYGPDPMER